ncbi:MAG: hypothetical protein RCG15_02895 [Candidatus Rickettsia vulgarisii]
MLIPVPIKFTAVRGVVLPIAPVIVAPPPERFIVPLEESVLSIVPVIVLPLPTLRVPALPAQNLHCQLFHH